MSRLIRIFIVCLVNLFLFQYLKYETNNVAVRIFLFVRIYPTLPLPCCFTGFLASDLVSDMSFVFLSGSRLSGGRLSIRLV